MLSTTTISIAVMAITTTIISGSIHVFSNSRINAGLPKHILYS